MKTLVDGLNSCCCPLATVTLFIVVPVGGAVDDSVAVTVSGVFIDVNDAALDVKSGITVPPAVLAETTVPAEFIICAPTDEDGVMMALWLRFVIVYLNLKKIVNKLSNKDQMSYLLPL